MFRLRQLPELFCDIPNGARWQVGEPTIVIRGGSQFRIVDPGKEELVRIGKLMQTYQLRTIVSIKQARKTQIKKRGPRRMDVVQSLT